MSKSETPVNEVKKQKTNENGEKQDVTTENLASKRSKLLPLKTFLKKKYLKLKAEDYGFETEEKKKDQKKHRQNRMMNRKEIRIKI